MYCSHLMHYNPCMCRAVIAITYANLCVILPGPSLGKLTELVVPEVKAHWEALAYSMGYEITQIVAIERNGRDEGERCTKLFRDWLSGSRGINSLRNGGQTWEELIVKIRNVDELNAAAERIQNKLLGSK